MVEGQKEIKQSQLAVLPEQQTETESSSFGDIHRLLSSPDGMVNAEQRKPSSNTVTSDVRVIANPTKSENKSDTKEIRFTSPILPAPEAVIAQLPLDHKKISTQEPYIKVTEPTKEETDFLVKAIIVSPELNEQVRQLTGQDYQSFNANDIAEINRRAAQSPEFEKHLSKILDSIVVYNADTWKRVKELINAEGCDPMQALLKAAKESRVIGIGEQHDGAKPGHIWAAQALKDLHDKAGISHLAIELPEQLQPVLDQLNNSPKGSPWITKIMSMDGKGDKNQEAAIAQLQGIVRDDPSRARLWVAARDAGIKVICVDNNSLISQSNDPRNPMLSQLFAQRDQDMAKNIMNIINDGAHDGHKPKVMVWLGAFHIAKNAYQLNSSTSGLPINITISKSVVKLLEDELKKTKAKMTTFDLQCGISKDAGLTPLTTQINRPVVVTTHQKNGKTNVLSKVKMNPGSHYQSSFESVDQVIIFPKK